MIKRTWPSRKPRSREILAPAEPWNPLYCLQATLPTDTQMEHKLNGKNGRGAFG